MFGLHASLRARASAFVLAAALVLAGSGAGALVFAPSTASAGVTPGIAPDFVVNPGDTVPKTFAKPLIGSAVVTSNPDDCRTNPAIGLTCAAFRIKVNRTADKNYVLRIITEWDAQAASVQAEPDIDTYLFDGPTSKFDSTQVGGAGSTEPEQIKITPAQDEYDLVVNAFAGAITGFKVTVSYTAGATLPAGAVTPDIVLAPHAAPYIHTYQSVLAGVPAVVPYPDACRNQPPYQQICDVYRIKLNRNHAKDATNFVVVTLDWNPVTVPAIDTPAIGLVSRPVPDLNMYVYDAPQHSLDGVGGTSIQNVPERVGWVATQDEYDLVVESAGGVATGYTLNAFMTDEIFGKPFEAIDPTTGKTLVQQPDGSLVPVTAPPSNEPAVSLPQIALAPIGADSQISNIGLGTTQQFNGNPLAFSASPLRATAATAKPPSGLALVLFLIVVPLGALGAAIVVVRRRHTAIF